MVTIVRGDLTPGERIAQTTHTVADYSAQFPIEFFDWKNKSNSVVCLETKNFEEFEKYLNKIKMLGIPYSVFSEPDMDNQLTAFSFIADTEIRKKFRELGLACGDNTKRRTKIYEQMLRCDQTSGMDMLDHGLAVFQKYKEIYKHLSGIKTSSLMMPSWLNSELINELAPLPVVFDYTIHHDCGKPSVMQYDENGKRHYPNHSQKSSEIAKYLGFTNQVCSLIEHDMDFHTLKSEDIAEFASNPNAITLMVVGVAEVLANAEMFGGFSSTSFKIKWKHIEKRGRQVLELINKNKKKQ